MGNSMQVPSNTKTKVTIWSSNPIPGHISRKHENSNSKDTCTPMFTAALLTITKTWKPPTKCLSIDEWIMKMCCVNIHTHTDTHTHIHTHMGLPRWLSGKESTCNIRAAGDVGLIPGSGRSPGGEHGNPLQYSCPENPKDRGHGGLQSIGLQTVRHNWSHLAHTYTYTHGILLNLKKKILSLAATCLNLKDYHTKWSKSDWEKQISYDITYMWNRRN